MVSSPFDCEYAANLGSSVSMQALTHARSSPVFKAPYALKSVNKKARALSSLSSDDLLARDILLARSIPTVPRRNSPISVWLRFGPHFQICHRLEKTATIGNCSVAKCEKEARRVQEKAMSLIWGRRKCGNVSTGVHTGFQSCSNQRTKPFEEKQAAESGANDR